LVKPDLSTTMSCPGYRPKQSDLVLTGVAETHFSRTSLDVRSVAQVLQAPAMVASHRRRSSSLQLPAANADAGLKANQSLVSFRTLAFPHLARCTAAYRALVAVEAAGQRLLVAADIVLVGRGRTELTLSLTAPAAARTAIAAAEVRLARLLLARVRA